MSIFLDLRCLMPRTGTWTLIMLYRMRNSSPRNSHTRSSPDSSTSGLSACLLGRNG